jgi:hypothetical protein
VGSGVRGILAGALALIALQVVVQAPASKRVAGLLGVPAAIAARFIDPRIPAIPERKAPASATPAEADPWAPPKTTAGLPPNPVPTSTTGGD